MAKAGLPKGLEKGKKSGKHQGILKRILSGNPVLMKGKYESENTKLQLSIFCEKVLDKKYLLKLNNVSRHPANDLSKLHLFVSFDV